MDLAQTLGLFLTIVSGVGVCIAALKYLFTDEAHKKGITRGLMTMAAFILLIGALIAQYVADPASSILTYPFFGEANALLPNTHSTLHACHVTIADLPSGAPGTAEPLFSPALDGKQLNISGSSVLFGLFTTAGRQFDSINNTVTSVQKLDSTTGLNDVLAGRADIGLSDIYAQESSDPTVVVSARALTDYHVAVAPFTLLVSVDLADIVQNLTSEQIVDIFSGKITNWRSIGGPDETITVFNRRLGSGTRANFEKYVLGIGVPNDDLRTGTTQTLLALMSKTRGAIGYAATTSMVSGGAKEVAPVCIDGFGATSQNINSGKYTFWSYEHAYVKQRTPLTDAFLAFVCSANFQSHVVSGAGFLRASMLRDTAIVTHTEDYPPPQPCS